MFCNKTGQSLMPDPQHIVVIPSLGVLYCITPKVASRQWRAMLCQFDDVPGQTQWLDFPPELQEKIVATYFKYTFVREPFERLLSAYIDKFLYPKTEDQPILFAHGPRILKKFRPNATKLAFQTLNDITFREFIEYLITIESNSSCSAMDWNWDNYVNVCGMRAVNYDFIGYYQTYDQDLADFQEAASLSSEQAGLFNIHSNNKSEAALRILNFYSQIPL